MNVTTRLRERFARDTTTYQCGVCSLTFDHDHPNCPACGSDVAAVDPRGA